MIKSPAAVVVVFCLPVWLTVNRRGRMREIATAAAVSVGVTAAVIAALTALSGLGTGWTRQVNAASPWVSWLSLPSGVVMLARAVSGSGHIGTLDATMRDARTVGAVVAIVALVALWGLAMRRSVQGVPTGFVGPLAAALGAVAVLGPSVQPWYYLWGLMLAGLVVRRRWPVVLLAWVGFLFAFLILPSGSGGESAWWGPIAMLLALAVVVRELRVRPTPAQVAERSLTARGSAS
jgi:alpha-1,6-mannosyltransferase